MLPTAAVFVLGGGKLGMLTGVGTAAAIIVYAVRAKVEAPFEVAEPAPGVPVGVLVVAMEAVEFPAAAAEIAAISASSRRSPEDGVLVLAPTQASRIDRWTSDLSRAQFQSQRILTISVATLAAAGLRAEGRVGDGDAMQAVEDALRVYAARAVVVFAPGEAQAETAALEGRLGRPLHRITPPGRGAGARGDSATAALRS